MELSYRFADVCEIFGIPKKGTSLCHRAMSVTLSLFLGADVLNIRVSGTVWVFC